MDTFISNKTDSNKTDGYKDRECETITLTLGPDPTCACVRLTPWTAGNLQYLLHECDKFLIAQSKQPCPSTVPVKGLYSPGSLQ